MRRATTIRPKMPSPRWRSIDDAGDFAAAVFDLTRRRSAGILQEAAGAAVRRAGGVSAGQGAAGQAAAARFRDFRPRPGVSSWGAVPALPEILQRGEIVLRSTRSPRAHRGKRRERALGPVAQEQRSGAAPGSGWRPAAGETAAIHQLDALSPLRAVAGLDNGRR